MVDEATGDSHAMHPVTSSAGHTLGRSKTPQPGISIRIDTTTVSGSSFTIDFAPGVNIFAFKNSRAVNQKKNFLQWIRKGKFRGYIRLNIYNLGTTGIYMHSCEE